MIGKGLLALFQVIISFGLEGLHALSLPVNLMQAVATFTGYGVWLVGADWIIIFCQCVLFWCSVKLTIGVVLFIWRLLPLT